MKTSFMRCRAYTVVEILIATGLLSLLMIGVFSMFSSSQKGFSSGTWRLQRQKQAQLLLLRFKETMEKVNHAHEVRGNGVVEMQGAHRLIEIGRTWLGKKNPTSNHSILFASITTPSKLANPDFDQLEQNGIWKGVSMECFNGTLSLYQTGRWDTMSSNTPLSIASPDLTKFVINNTENDFIIKLEDVKSIGFFVKNATESAALDRPEVLLTCELTLVMPRSDGRTVVNEKITARIMDREMDQVVGFSESGFVVSAR